MPRILSVLGQPSARNVAQGMHAESALRGWAARTRARRRGMIWSQSRNGTPIDLLNPRVEQVDFREIADTLAQINRFAGCSLKPVSVALHTLICLKAAEHEGLQYAMPWIALHDAPEARLGDIITPTKRLLFREIELHFDTQNAQNALDAIYHLHREHFRVICEAAMLGPSEGTILHQDIRRIDNLALMAERASFLAPPPQSWGDDLEPLTDHPFVRRRQKWLPPDRAADALYERFTQLLPALRRNAASELIPERFHS